jgi:hypothetical protein
MKFICVQPAIDYYAWQVEVMINNFIRNGVDPEDIQIISSYSRAITSKWYSLKDTYKQIKFYFYQDERKGHGYISSIRPHVLHKHWLHYPELEKETIFYYDCDILFTKPIDFSNLEKDNVCYLSDTISYIGAKYIKSKGENYFELMTEIVGVDPQVVIDNEKDSGGAQYILKGITADFWNKVYNDSEKIFTTIVKKQNGNPSEPFQIWCADMWAVLWNLWVYKKEVKVTPEMSFAWATSPIRDWDRYSIFHNAGVVGPNNKLFYKGQYINKLPFDIKLEEFTPTSCSYKYAEEILKTKEVTCLL